jgi:hypothetical protein
MCPRFFVIINRNATLREINGNYHIFANNLWVILPLSHWLTVGGNFPSAFLYLLGIARGYPTAFGHFPAAFLYSFSNAPGSLIAFRSISQRISEKTWQFPSRSKGSAPVNIY